jgi:hypothetical protein
MASREPPRADRDKGRLTPVDRSREILPWRRATELRRFAVYWLPVRGVPAPAEQRVWQQAFFDRLFALTAKKMGLRVEVFLQFKTAMEVNDLFQKTAMEFNPLLGLSRRPGAKLPAMPTHEELHEDPDACLRGEKKIDIRKYLADYCYWFVNKAEKKQREAFLGLGGLTMLLLKPDPKTTPPPLYFSPHVRQTNLAFQKMDVDAVVAGGFSMLDGFLEKSKQLFGQGLEDDAQFQGIQFILPLLGSADFFQQPEAESKKWFDLFEIYVNESPADKGVLLASKGDLDEDLIELLRQMRDDGLRYPER